MAIVLLGGGIIDYRGSVSGNTFSRSRFGVTVRGKVSPVQVSSSFKGRPKSLLVRFSRGWSQSITEAQRAEWNSFALTNPSTNVFGQVSYLSGQQWFVKYNVNSFLSGGILIEEPPASSGYAGLDSLTIEATAGGTDEILITASATEPPGTPFIHLLITRCLSPGIYYANGQFKDCGFLAYTAAETDIISNWSTRYVNLSLQAGKKLYCLANLIDQDSGKVSPSIMASCTIA